MTETKTPQGRDIILVVLFEESERRCAFMPSKSAMRLDTAGCCGCRAGVVERLVLFVVGMIVVGVTLDVFLDDDDDDCWRARRDDSAVARG
jgi:hypothetical protein